MVERNNNNKYSFRHRVLALSVLCLFGFCLWTNAVAQDAKEPAKSKVFLLHADVLKKSKDNPNPEAQILVGDVVFRHDSIYMYCDSACFYEKSNKFEAFSNVKMEQGDTLFLYGDCLYYDGNIQLAKVRQNVRMENKNTVLTTDSLDYDRIANLGYYFDGGKLVDEENELTSYWGQYSPATKFAEFNDEVNLVNAQFTLTSDTLRYNTMTKIANIVGPSHIHNQQNYIYSEMGFYHTQIGQAELLNRSYLMNDGKRMTGDSLFYDRNKGYGEAFDHVVYTDTLNKNMLTGNYCYYNELTKNAFATDSAVAIDYSQGDSLFMHADTLQLYNYYLDTDSMYREMRAHYKVRAYRTDVQAVCDSLVFSSKDSCLTMYNNPIIWNNNQQLLGEQIKVYMNDSTIDWAHIKNQALSVERIDSVHYNQVSGKDIMAYFEGGEMRQVDVKGTVRLVYYPQEKDSTILFGNVSETSLLNVYLKDRKMTKMRMSPNSNGMLYPLSKMNKDKMYLKNFNWLDYIRPVSKQDIFVWRAKRAEDVLQKSKRGTAPKPNQEIFNQKKE